MKITFYSAVVLLSFAVLFGGCRSETGHVGESIKITGLTVASESPYEVVHAGFRIHLEQYTDRFFRYREVPRELIGATYIRTANDDKSVAYGSDRFLAFTVNQRATVYVAHDNRIVPKPEWMKGWRDTGLILESDDNKSQGFALFSKDFPAGQVMLGGNAGEPVPHCMYSVLVVPAGRRNRNRPPVPDAGVDRTVRGLDEPLLLDASAVDDRLSKDELTYAWTSISGPGIVAFSHADATRTTATFSEIGAYELYFSVSDGVHTATDTVKVEVLPSPAPFELAKRNAQQANEGFNRSHSFLQAWLSIADKATGLIPYVLGGPPVWSIKNSAADCYPFMVLSAEITAPDLFEGPCLEMLHSERRLTSRIDSLPDDWNYISGEFVFREPHLPRIQFGASEYVKDGLIAITEWIGESPWQDRMLELVDDSWKHADIETPFGLIVSTDTENNGEMLQVLPRLYWMTGDQKYLDWALRLGDYYLLGTNHPTRDLEELRLRDHGCEVVSGLCELYATCHFARPDKYAEYKAPLYEMLDRILEVGTNPDGLFYDIINPVSGEAILSRLGDTFGYNYNGYYTVYLVDGHEPYRQAVKRVLKALYRYPGFHGAEPMDGHCDAIESVLYLINKERHINLDDWLDDAIEDLWDFQKPDGTVIRNYLDGNFARTTLLYCLWKTQGTTLRPWRKDLLLGASREEDTLEVFVSAKEAWEGRLQFDVPRHDVHLNLPLNWTRINQFSPEWTTVEADEHYTIENMVTGERTVYSGSQLQQGLSLQLARGEKLRLRLVFDDS